jgi:hypothetical protein
MPKLGPTNRHTNPYFVRTNALTLAGPNARFSGMQSSCYARSNKRLHTKPSLRSCRVNRALGFAPLQDVLSQTILKMSELK